MRKKLQDIRFNGQLARNRQPHAGLAFDCCFPIGKTTEIQDNQKNLFKGLSELNAPDYRNFFERWRTNIKDFPDTEIREAQSQGRLIIGLGNETVAEAGIAIHHTYGVPYLPGTALKGLAASYARNHLEDWEIGSEGYRTMFGYSDEQDQSMGMVVFHDALPMESNLHTDVIAVHHPKYYQEADTPNIPPPADWDSPVPVSFLSARGRFVIALSGPEAWRNAAFEILKRALEEEGIGGKTTSGYGRVAIERPKVNAEIDSLLEATVARIDGNKVTYQINSNEQRMTVKEPKNAASLAEGQTVTVKVDAIKEDGSIKSVKLAK